MTDLIKKDLLLAGGGFHYRYVYTSLFVGGDEADEGTARKNSLRLLPDVVIISIYKLTN
jgi:hypothetical protein